MRYSIEVVDEVVLSIENGYNAFKMKHKELNTFSGIEYFGLNFDNNLNNSIIFKIYYTNNRSNNETNEFLRFLYKRNMIHTLNKIHDNINYGRVRYEIGLKNRTNDNMIWLYNNLKILYPKLILKEDEIKKFSTLKCTDLKNYKYASMYFFGFISTIEDDTIIDIEALKFHYILRKCENPDKIGKKFIINNEDIFDTINKMHIDELDMILNIIKDVINKSNAELWMMGIDYFKNDKCKYKIYI